MQAIVTKYLGPTETKPSRIKAMCDADSITLPAPDACEYEEAHRYVAEQLRDKLGWTGELVQGWLPARVSLAYCFVFEPAPKTAEDRGFVDALARLRRGVYFPGDEVTTKVEGTEFYLTLARGVVK